MKNRSIFLTFIAIALPIMIFGILGVYLSVNRIHDQYIKLQLKANNRTADLVSRLFENRLDSGEQQDDLLVDFQYAVSGSQIDQGYLCMFDREKGTLIGHPNPDAVGMNIDSENMSFQSGDGNAEVRFYQAVTTNNPEAGIFNIDDPSRSEIVYMIPIEGTNWKVSVHENLESVDRQLTGLQQYALGGFFFLALVMSVISTWIVYRINKRHKREIAAKDQVIEKQRAKLSVRY